MLSADATRPAVKRLAVRLRDAVAGWRRWPQRALLAGVQAYRYLLSPWLGPSCRFEPTCSAYALQAIEQHGAAAGTYLTLHRLARCQPFCAAGHDPVPAAAPALFRRLIGTPPPP